MTPCVPTGRCLSPPELVRPPTLSMNPLVARGSWVQRSESRTLDRALQVEEHELPVCPVPRLCALPSG